MSDGHYINTMIKKKKKDILKYYLGGGSQDYDMANPDKTRRAVDVEFLD